MGESEKINPKDALLKWVIGKSYPRNFAREIEEFSDPIDLFCVQCKKERTFRLISPSIKMPKTPSIAAVMPTYGGLYSLANYSEDKLPPSYFLLEFACPSIEGHRAIYIFRTDKTTIIKIGEYPSYSDTLFPEIEIYRDLLDSYFIELRTAIRLYCYNVGIGSFVYLRRIFEKVIIDVAIKKYEKDSSWKLENYRIKHPRIEDIIKDLSSDLPNFLVENKRIYKILSKGIHELNETECMDMFDVLKASIEEILDEIIEKEKKNKTRKILGDKIAKIK